MRSFLSTVTPFIYNFKGKMKGIEICSAMYGLQGMNSDVFAVEVLLDAIADKFAQCTCTLTPHGISNFLAGFQSMTSNSEAVRRLIRLLIPKIQSCQNPFSARDISDALFGNVSFLIILCFL